MKLLAFLVDKRFDRRAEPSRRHRRFFLSRGRVQEAVKDKVEILAEIKRISEEIISSNEVCHNGLLG